MPKVVFSKEDHRYMLFDENTGEILGDLVSVTTLLKKHGLAPDYSMVNEEVLNAKAERGTIVHEELENYINNGEEMGFTSELLLFINKCKEMKIKPLISEFMVHNNEIAGTVDVAGIIGDNELPFIGDFKTTATLHRETVAWQLSLYAYLNTDTIYERFLVFHFPDENTCKVVELQPIPDAEIEELLRCERDCELYQKKTLELTVEDSEKIVAIQNELKLLDDRKKELEKQESELKSFLIKKMEETGVKSIDNEYFKITYVAPFERTSVDAARLKEDFPDLAAQYQKTSLTKASVRITLKGN